MSLFNLDLHVHTREVSGCAKVAAQELPGLFKSAGYDGLVITDHYVAEFFQVRMGLAWDECIRQFLAGYFNARAAAKNLAIQILLGVELRLECDLNDYLLVGVTQEFLLRCPALTSYQPAALKKLAEKNGLLVFQAHPFRYGKEAVNPDWVHGVEIYNGNSTQDSRNNLAQRFAETNRLLRIAGSDFHCHAELGKGGMRFKHPITDEQQLVSALRQQEYHGFIGV